MAFAKPKIAGKEFEIALTFHNRVPDKSEPDLPPMLANLVNNNQPDVLALGYAPAAPDYSKTSPFDTILNEPKLPGRFFPQLGAGGIDWLATPLPPVVFTKEEQKCLATAIYFEARSESVKGQAAVAQVILNRVRNPAYPKTICKVVYQNDDWINRCQFSFACEGRKLNVTEPKQSESGAGSRHGRHIGADFPAGDWFSHALSRSLCPGDVGAYHEAHRQDRPAHLLSHLWRRLDLIFGRLETTRKLLYSFWSRGTSFRPSPVPDHLKG